MKVKVIEYCEAPSWMKLDLSNKFAVNLKITYSIFKCSISHTKCVGFYEYVKTQTELLRQIGNKENTKRRQNRVE